jgi:hypothetical protein
MRALWAVVLVQDDDDFEIWKRQQGEEELFRAVEKIIGWG